MVIAELLEQSHRELAGTDARVYRRVQDYLQRSSAALHDLQALQALQATRTQDPKALLGKGSFLQQPAASLKRLCKAHGIKGYSKLQKAALAQLLERHGVTPPTPPLESFSKKELIALVRQLLGEG